MDPDVAKTLSFRFIELEQRFESYSALHEEELKEIRAMLNEMRGDILKLSRELRSNDSPGAPPCPEGKATAESPENSLSLAL